VIRPNRAVRRKPGGCAESLASVGSRAALGNTGGPPIIWHLPMCHSATLGTLTVHGDSLTAKSSETCALRISGCTLAAMT
jgi:hypothetical protein